MKIEVNALANHLARTSFCVEEITHSIRKPGQKHLNINKSYPGFVFPIKGTAELVFNGTSYSVSPGNILHGGAQMELLWRVIGNSNWEYILVLYRICGHEQGGLSLSSAHFELPIAQSVRMVELLWRLRAISNQFGGITAFQTETLFRNVLEEVFVSAHRQNNMDSKTLFEQVIKYIHEHYADDLSIPMLAEQNGVNKNRLTYVFNKYIGMGPGGYLLQYRLNRAKEFLLESNASVHEIAHVVGFNDPFHFSKAFKNKFGISPSEFRK